MAEPFVGEIRLFAGARVPERWALCDGALLDIGANQALFSLLGTTYGGDGRQTFALPDLRGRVPIHRGQGKGLSHRRQGSKGGTEAVVIKEDGLPPHSHAVRVSTAIGNQADPTDSYLAASSAAERFRTSGATAGFMHAESVTFSGQSAPHNNMAPFHAVSAIIALEGIYPNRY
ncbi:MAG: tail fiber protein [Pseudomonadota bacterium]